MPIASNKLKEVNSLSGLHMAPLPYFILDSNTSPCRKPS